MSSLDAVHSLLLQAPLSQLPSVLSDIRGLLSASSSSGANPQLAQEFEASLPSVLRRLHEKEGKIIRLPGLEQGSIIASEAAEELDQQAAKTDDDHAASSDHAYRDASKTKRFTVDHVKALSTSNETYRPHPTSESSLRSDLDHHLQLYLADHYPEFDAQRPDQGAAGQVWHLPARKLKVIWSKVIEDETQKTSQEEAMAEKLQEDREAADNKESEAADKDGEAAQEGEADNAAIDVETYGTKDAQDDAAAGGLETVADKEIRPDEAYDEEGYEGQEGELIEQEDPLNPTETERYVIKIVSGKSNAGNFWSGRLLSTYVYTPGEQTLDSTLKVQIHYYENGNVQLNTLNNSKITLQDTSPKGIISTIAKYEAKSQDLFEDTYDSLNEKAFKSLRRVLPVTRQKVDWDKVLNYRLGSDLADAQAK